MLPVNLSIHREWVSAAIPAATTPVPPDGRSDQFGIRSTWCCDHQEMIADEELHRLRLISRLEALGSGAVAMRYEPMPPRQATMSPLRNRTHEMRPLSATLPE